MSLDSDYGTLREDVMADMRKRVRELAHQGLCASEIRARLARLDSSLTVTESELLGRVIRAEARSARLTRIADSWSRRE
jgi:hypothetical protein